MSRSGYSDDCDNLGLWRGAVERAIRGKRGQAFLREMLAALGALPSKRIIRDELVTRDGECCALGSVALARQTAVKSSDYDRDVMARMFDIAPAMAAEIMFENDDDFGIHSETPEQRWARMRAWVAKQITETP